MDFERSGQLILKRYRYAENVLLGIDPKRTFNVETNEQLWLFILSWDLTHGSYGYVELNEYGNVCVISQESQNESGNKIH